MFNSIDISSVQEMDGLMFWKLKSYVGAETSIYNKLSNRNLTSRIRLYIYL